MGGAGEGTTTLDTDGTASLSGGLDGIKECPLAWAFSLLPTL